MKAIPDTTFLVRIHLDQGNTHFISMYEEIIGFWFHFQWIKVSHKYSPIHLYTTSCRSSVRLCGQKVQTNFWGFFAGYLRKNQNEEWLNSVSHRWFSFRVCTDLRPRQNGCHFLDDSFIFQYWFRYWLGASQVTSHHLNQWWLVYWCIYAYLSLNELNHCLKSMMKFTNTLTLFPRSRS